MIFEVSQSSFYFDKGFFGYGQFLKSLLNLLQYCFFLMFWIFGGEAGGLLALRQGIPPTPPALECSLNPWTAREVLQCSF